MTEAQKHFIKTCVNSHMQELKELKNNHGLSNVKDFWYSEEHDLWFLTFEKGEKQEFDTKESLLKWILTPETV